MLPDFEFYFSGRHERGFRMQRIVTDFGDEILIPLGLKPLRRPARQIGLTIPGESSVWEPPRHMQTT